MKRIISIILFFAAAGSYSYAQKKQHMTGLLPDDGRYDQLPKKAELLTRDYKIMPTEHSLMQYCPEVKSQSVYGTCCGWATGYAARSIAEAIKHDWKDKTRITNEAFSPLFVYTLIKGKNDNNCQKGGYLSDALEIMKRRGVAKYSSFDVLCASYINKDLLTAASKFKIDGYFRLFDLARRNPTEKIRKVKKSLSEDRPVVIGMWLPDSFHDADSIWDGSGIIIDPKKHGYHAMCVIGYNDNKNGGSFQIMNSWGKDWGEKGFVWVKYNDFSRYVDEGYEIYIKKEQPKPIPSPKNHYMDGEMRIASHNGSNTMPVFYSSNGQLPHYITTENYLSGSKFRLYINNKQPAWVYVIASDIRNNVTKLFPYDDTISAYMNYKDNNFALPDEQHEFEFDNTAGTDYFCVLYSQEELNINNIVKQIEQVNGSFYQKLSTVLGDKIVHPQDIRYIQNYLGFSAKSDHTIVPLVVEISHKDIGVQY